MTEFFKNNPLALHHCLLYKYLQKNTDEQSFNVFCKMIGDDVIKKEEFHFWFNQFEQGIFDDNKKPITDMREVLRNDKYALRACIFYESIKYEGHVNLTRRLHLLRSKIDRDPSFFMYNNFCNVVGEDMMEYREFDFRFYRFLNGDYNLNSEMDKDAKIHELMDMPIDVMETVAKYLNLFDRVKLAKTSRSLQTFVEDQKLFHDTLGLEVDGYAGEISYGQGVQMKYIQWNTGCTKRINRRETHFEGVSFWKEAILDFKNILKNPKLYLNTLETKFLFGDEFFDNFASLVNVLEDELKFTHYLNVKELHLVEYSSEKLLKILPLLKPGYLTTIDIFSPDSNIDSMEIVFEMEQWKQAKRFYMEGGDFIWQLHNLYHFKSFHVRLVKLSVEDVRQMKEILFKSPNFEGCTLIISDEIERPKFEQEFGIDLRQVPCFYHYQIPNSTEYFEIICGKDIKITKKKYN